MISSNQLADRFASSSEPDAQARVLPSLACASGSEEEAKRETTSHLQLNRQRPRLRVLAHLLDPPELRRLLLERRGRGPVHRPVQLRLQLAQLRLEPARR